MLTPKICPNCEGYGCEDCASYGFFIEDSIKNVIYTVKQNGSTPGLGDPIKPLGLITRIYRYLFNYPHDLIWAIKLIKKR